MWGQTLSRSYGRCIAEFLSEGSLERLRILSSSTCVGFSTDTPNLKRLEAFLEGSADQFGTQCPPHDLWDYARGFTYEPPSGFPPLFQQWVDLWNPVPPSHQLEVVQEY